MDSLESFEFRNMDKKRVQTNQETDEWEKELEKEFTDGWSAKFKWKYYAILGCLDTNSEMNGVEFQVFTKLAKLYMRRKIVCHAGEDNSFQKLLSETISKGIV